MSPLQSAFRYECQLIKTIWELHHDGISKLPSISPTSSLPIDWIFVSSHLRHTAKRGWISINESIGDHCALFIDISLQTLLGENPLHIHWYTARRLVCDKPKTVLKLNKLLRHQLESQLTLSQFDKFMEMYENRLFYNSKEAIIHLDEIDLSITNSIPYAEKKCQKLNTGNVPYTP